MNIYFFKPKDILYILLGIFLLCSCQQKERDFSTSLIEVDVTSNAKLKLSDFFENFRMVKLQSDVVIGGIRRIRYENNLIYISDVKTLFVFSNSGELLSYFNHSGVGPREYVGITDFVVDDDTITILDRTSQKLLKYNHSGDYFSEHKLGYYAWAISPTVDRYNFLYCGYENILLNFPSKLRRMCSGQPDSLYLFIKENQADFMHFRYKDNFFRNQDAVYFFELFNDTIYKSIRGSNIQPFYCVDYKGKNVPSSFFSGNYANVVEFRQEYNKTSYAHGVFSFVEFDRFLMFGSNYQQKIKLTIFDRKEEISHTFSDVVDDVYFNDLTFPEIMSYQADKHIFFIINAYQAVEWRKENSPKERFKEIVNDTEEDDNPLLLIFDFKQ